MKIVAYYALHYGREWLYWSLQAIRPHVDEIVVVYSPVPSHGSRTDVPCPETEDQLYAIAERFDVRWWTKTHGFPFEGAHRDYAVGLCTGILDADIVLPVDHDEIWDPEHLKRVLEYVKMTNYRDYRVSMQHFWRSTDWVCRDPLMPVRVIKPGGVGENYVPHMGYIHHFGYAQSPRIVEYKWRIHGHINEVRPGWFDNTFMKWHPGQLDVHPTNVDFWTAAAYDKVALQHLIGDHPYYNMTCIGNSVVNALDGAHEQLSVTNFDIVDATDVRFGWKP